MSETPDEQTARLRQFVLDWCDGHIFSDRHCRSADDVRLVFMVLALADIKLIPDDTGLVYEHISRAGPTSINGMPTFFSVRFLTQAEVDRVMPAIEAEQARRKAVTV